MVVRLTGAVLAACILGLCASSASASTLDNIRDRKILNCGVNPGLAGFSVVDEQEVWSGFDVDYCRAIAAAVLGDANAVNFVPLTARERFRELQSGRVDVLVRDTAWTMGRDTVFGLTFVGVNYYNGFGFMVRKSLGLDSALQLSGTRVCVETGSAGEVAVTQFFATNGMNYTAVSVENDEQQKAAYEMPAPQADAAGATSTQPYCDVYTGDLVSLYGARLRLTAPDDSVVLPQSLSKEPYGPVVLQDDDQWFAIVKWVHFALVNAEELGVTAANVDQMLNSPNEDARNLLGSEGAFGEGIGLTNDWAANAVRAVGNYGEIFDRNLGANSSLKIPRGLNALWTNGGLQFAPPIR